MSSDLYFINYFLKKEKEQEPIERIMKLNNSPYLCSNCKTQFSEYDILKFINSPSNACPFCHKTLSISTDSGGVDKQGLIEYKKKVIDKYGYVDIGEYWIMLIVGSLGIILYAFIVFKHYAD